jgi:hypothetical protein
MYSYTAPFVYHHLHQKPKKMEMKICLPGIPLLIDIFSFRHGSMGAKWLVATALITHRVYHIQDRADGKQKDETADEDGKDDEKDDGPSVFPPLGQSLVLLLPAYGLVHFVELVVACGTCLARMSVAVSCGFERVCRGKNLHE